ncbi:MFS transporter, partial [Salmonella enterica]|uniref:MFS transporter n=1 Tax=Salmonella enterica TaxID=28901 RepID=UPI001D0C70C0
MQATATTLDHEQEHVPVNSRNKVVIASLIGTAIEFFDFYIYATAAVIVFPLIFFPQGDPTAATLQSLATFAIAFVARPIGSALFGHFGDRVGRKVTLVASLLTMGISTVIIGLLPGYATIGIFAPLLLALARFGQGLGLNVGNYIVGQIFGDDEVRVNCAAANLNITNGVARPQIFAF